MGIRLQRGHVPLQHHTHSKDSKGKLLRGAGIPPVRASIHSCRRLCRTRRRRHLSLGMVAPILLLLNHRTTLRRIRRSIRLLARLLITVVRHSKHQTLLARHPGQGR